MYSCSLPPCRGKHSKRNPIYLGCLDSPSKHFFSVGQYFWMENYRASGPQALNKGSVGNRSEGFGIRQTWIWIRAQLLLCDVRLNLIEIIFLNQIKSGEDPYFSGCGKFTLCHCGDFLAPGRKEGFPLSPIHSSCCSGPVPVVCSKGGSVSGSTPTMASSPRRSLQNSPRPCVP